MIQILDLTKVLTHIHLKNHQNIILGHLNITHQEINSKK